jgi:hypothetical protein
MALDDVQLLQATEQHVQQILAGNDASHDYSHIGVCIMYGYCLVRDCPCWHNFAQNLQLRAPAQHSGVHQVKR